MSMTREEQAIAAASRAARPDPSSQVTPWLYPARKWIEDAGNPYYVPPELREDYARVRLDPFTIGVDTHVRDIGSPFGPPCVQIAGDEYAHVLRLATAREWARKRERDERDRRHTQRPCPACGKPGTVGGWQSVPVVPGKVYGRMTQVCTTCGPILQRALEELERAVPESEILPDGRTRLEAVRAFATEVSGRA